MAKVKLNEKQLKRGKSELEGGFKNATGKEYLIRLIKDFEGLIK